jgi:CheY-specific phosphatase CheX
MSTRLLRGTGIARPIGGRSPWEEAELRADVVDPFVASAFAVLRELGQINCERGPLSMREGDIFTTQELNVALAVTGEVEGLATYGMSVITGLKIASLITGSELLQVDEKALDALTELGRRLSEQTAALLEHTNTKCEIRPLPPIHGIGTKVTSCAPALLVPVNTDVGKISIEVSLCKARYEQRVEIASGV